MSAPEKKTKKRRTLTLRKVLLIDLVLLLLVAVGLSVLEVRIMERKQKENLAARLNKNLFGAYPVLRRDKDGNGII